MRRGLAARLGCQVPVGDLHMTLTDCERTSTLCSGRMTRAATAADYLGLGRRPAIGWTERCLPGHSWTGVINRLRRPRYSRCTQRLFLMNVLRLCATGCLTTWRSEEHTSELQSLR